MNLTLLEMFQNKALYDTWYMYKCRYLSFQEMIIWPVWALELLTDLVLYTGPGLSAVLVWRLWRMETLTWINEMFLIYFSCDTVFGNIETFFLLKLQRERWVCNVSTGALSNHFSANIDSDPEAHMTNCLNFLGTRWLWSCNRPIFQTILIFCRWLKAPLIIADIIEYCRIDIIEYICLIFCMSV